MTTYQYLHEIFKIDHYVIFQSSIYVLGMSDTGSILELKRYC